MGGSPGESTPAKDSPVGIERHPTRETTLKRSNGNTNGSSTASTTVPQPKAPGPKKEKDFFSELGMEPEYQRPRTGTASDSSKTNATTVGKSRSISAMLEETGMPTGDVTANGNWGGDDLDLGL